eukprot:12377918-Karenia_brevis.AAC.1
MVSYARGPRRTLFYNGILCVGLRGIILPRKRCNGYGACAVHTLFHHCILCEGLRRTLFYHGIRCGGLPSYS